MFHVQTVRSCLPLLCCLGRLVAFSSSFLIENQKKVGLLNLTKIKNRPGGFTDGPLTAVFWRLSKKLPDFLG